MSEAPVPSPDQAAGTARPRMPILLVHGLGGFDQIRLELLYRYPLKIDYFKGIAALLQSEGAAAVLTAALPPTGSIAERAQTLKTFADATIREPRFHIIAHSMGGLDSRYYITHLGGDARVVSLTTLGTPHRGSALAQITADMIFGACTEASGRLKLDGLVQRLQAGAAGHRDLRPEDCAVFNAATPDRPGVVYRSWAGAPGAAEVPWFLTIPWRMLSRGEGGGPNDGLVTVESARWSGWQGTVPADHVSLVGWQFSRRVRAAFDVMAFYRDQLPGLAAAETACLDTNRN